MLIATTSALGQSNYLLHEKHFHFAKTVRIDFPIPKSVAHNLHSFSAGANQTPRTRKKLIIRARFRVRRSDSARVIVSMPSQKKKKTVAINWRQAPKSEILKKKKTAQTKRKVCPRGARSRSASDGEGDTGGLPARDRDGEYDARDDLGDVGCWVANVMKQTCRTAVSRSWC